MVRIGIGSAGARGALVAAVAAIGVVLAAPREARGDFHFETFESPRNLIAYGDARRRMNIRYPYWSFWYELTPAEASKTGSLWYTHKQGVAPGFDTTFEFVISDRVGGGADGFAFVIQNTASNVVGEGGGSMGYGGIPNSLAVEYDTWQNADDSPSGNHISVQTAGPGSNSPGSSCSLGWTGAIQDLFWVHTSRIRYVPGTLEVYLDGRSVLSVATDLSSLLTLDEGTAWVGFTAATGGSAEKHRLYSWTYDVLPEPTTLLFLAIGGLMVLPHRRRGAYMGVRDQAPSRADAAPS